MSVEQEILDLLQDGETRSAAEVAADLSDGSGFIQRREIARKVQRALPDLVARSYLRRLIFGAPGSSQYHQAYVLTSSVSQVCLACFRTYWSMDLHPPQMSENVTALCTVCGRRTSNGAYVPTGEAERMRRER